MSARSVLASLVLGALVLSATSVGEAQRRRRRRAPATGQLTLLNTVEGAEVLVDEDSVGFTPVDPIELTPGTHTVRLRRPGYTEFDEVVEIRPGRNTELEAPMIALSMILTVRSEPDEARVFVDDAFRGTTPLELELNDGEHAIRVVAPRYREQTEQITAIPGQTDLLSVELERIPDELLEPRTLEWYEEPLTWGLIGGGVVLVALAVTLGVYFGTQTDPQADWCGSDGSNCLLSITPGNVPWVEEYQTLIMMPME